jgi:hypothetical protein
MKKNWATTTKVGKWNPGKTSYNPLHFPSQLYPFNHHCKWVSIIGWELKLGANESKDVEVKACGGYIRKVAAFDG